MIEKINDKAEEILNTVFGKFFPLTLLSILTFVCMVFVFMVTSGLIHYFGLIFIK
jgi:hypothetical protein